MARVFISHASRDNAAAAEVLAWLEAQGFEHAFLDFDDSHGIPPGSRWERELYEQLEICQAVILLLTPNWFDSRWCFAEFVQARAAGKAIFPIIVAPCGERYVASDIQQLDLLSDRQGGLNRLATELMRVALFSQGGFEWDRSGSPYPGLAAFEADDAAVYFGRDPEIRALIERLEARRVQGGSRIVAVIGASGSGKSSLVRAGVLPRLMRDRAHWRAMPPLRPRADPLRELAKSWAVLRGEPERWTSLADHLGGLDAAGLADLAEDTLARSGAVDACLLITVDQAEELFTVASDAARAAFGRALAALSASSVRVLVLLTMRSEMFGQWQGQAPSPPSTEVFSLAPMPMERLVDVVEGPARIAGIRMDPQLVPAITADAAGNRDALPVIAFVLRQLAGSQTSSEITLDAYRRLGDAQGGLSPLDVAVRDRADAVLATLQLDATGLDALRDVFVDRLTTLDTAGRPTRQPARWRDLDEAARRALDAFVEARLLASRQEGEERIVEVAHEALLRTWPTLHKWLLDEADFLGGRLQLEHARVEWNRTAPERKADALLQGVLLERAGVWLARRPNGLSPAQRDFIEESHRHAAAVTRRARRQRLAIGTLGGAALLLGGVLLLLWQQQRGLERNLQAQDYLRLSSSALDSMTPDRALSLAAKAMRTAPNIQARSALVQTGLALPPELHDRRAATAPIGAASAPVTLTTLSRARGGAGWFVGTASGEVDFLPQAKDAEAQVVLGASKVPDKNRPQAVLALRGTGERWSAILADGRVLDGSGRGETSVRWHGQALEAAAWSPDISAALVVTDDRRVLLLDCHRPNACEAEPLSLPAGPGRAIAWSADGSEAAVALADGRVALIDRATRPASTNFVGRAADAGELVDWLSLARRSGDTRWIASDSKGRLHWIEAASSQRAEPGVPAYDGPATRLTWADDGSRLAGACGIDKVCIWQESDGRLRLRRVLPGHRAPVAALAWSGQDGKLVSADIIGQMLVWDLDAKTDVAPLVTLDDATGAALADLSCDARGMRLAAASSSGDWYTWDLSSGRLTDRRSAPELGELRAAQLHPSQPWLALAGLQQAALVRLDPKSGGSVTVQSGDARVETLRWSVDGTQLALGLHDGTMLAASIPASIVSEAPLRALPLGSGRHAEAVLAIGAVPQSEQRAAAAAAFYSTDALGVIRASDTTSAPVLDLSAITGRPVGLDSVSFTPDASRWLVAGNHGDVFVFSRGDQRLLARLETGADMITSAAFSPDGAFIAAADNQQRLHIWRNANFEPYMSVALRARPGHLPTDATFGVGSLRRVVWTAPTKLAVATQSGLVVLVSISERDWLARADTFAPMASRQAASSENNR